MRVDHLRLSDFITMSAPFSRESLGGRIAKVYSGRGGQHFYEIMWGVVLSLGSAAGLNAICPLKPQFLRIMIAWLPQKGIFGAEGKRRWPPLSNFRDEVRWTAAEKKVARKALDQALERHLSAITSEAKRMMANVADPTDL